MIPIIIFIITLIIFYLIINRERDEVSVSPSLSQSLSPSPQLMKKFRATVTDGDNTVLAVNNNGDFKQASNILKIDAINIKPTGDLTIDNNLNIEGNLKVGNKLFFKKGIEEGGKNFVDINSNNELAGVNIVNGKLTIGGKNILDIINESIPYCSFNGTRQIESTRFECSNNKLVKIL